MNDVQLFWSLCAECVQFLSQRRGGAILTESRHGDGQTDKQGLDDGMGCLTVIFRGNLAESICD